MARLRPASPGPRDRERHVDPPARRTPTLGALNVYSRAAGALASHEQQWATQFAEQASSVLLAADSPTRSRTVDAQLLSALESREVIALAQGAIMNRQRLSPDAAYINAVRAAIERLLPEMPREKIIRASLEGRGALIHTRSMEEACAVSNRIAPEHLEVSSREPQRWLPLLKHAGAMFLGAYTSESLGDYCAGPNHVLPTSGTARFSSPLGVTDFQKRSSLIEVSEQGAQVLGPIAAELAYGEGLQAHARAAQMRLKG